MLELKRQFGATAKNPHIYEQYEQAADKAELLDDDCKYIVRVGQWQAGCLARFAGADAEYVAVGLGDIAQLLLLVVDAEFFEVFVGPVEIIYAFVPHLAAARAAYGVHFGMVELVDKFLAGRQFGVFFGCGLILVAAQPEDAHDADGDAEFLPAHAADKHHCHAYGNGDNRI